MELDPKGGGLQLVAAGHPVSVSESCFSDETFRKQTNWHLILSIAVDFSRRAYTFGYSHQLRSLICLSSSMNAGRIKTSDTLIVLVLPRFSLLRLCD